LVWIQVLSECWVTLTCRRPSGTRTLRGPGPVNCLSGLPATLMTPWPSPGNQLVEGRYRSHEGARSGRCGKDDHHQDVSASAPVSRGWLPRPNSPCPSSDFCTRPCEGSPSLQFRPTGPMGRDRARNERHCSKPPVASAPILRNDGCQIDDRVRCRLASRLTFLLRTTRYLGRWRGDLLAVVVVLNLAVCVSSV